jgi:hypothetical protein
MGWETMSLQRGERCSISVAESARKVIANRFMANHLGFFQSRFFPAKLEAEGEDAIFNTLLSSR